MNIKIKESTHKLSLLVSFVSMLSLLFFANNSFAKQSKEYFETTVILKHENNLLVKSAELKSQSNNQSSKLSAEKRKIYLSSIIKTNKAFAISIADEYGITVTRVFGVNFIGFSGYLSEQQTERLKQDRRIKSFSKNRVLNQKIINRKTLQSELSQSKRNTNALVQETSWGLIRIGAENATNTASGTHLFVVDSGINLNHIDLKSTVIGGHAVVDCVSTTNAICIAPWSDDHGHGTFVAGIIAAQNNSDGIVGVSTGVNLHSIKVSNNNNSTTALDVAQGLEYVSQKTLELGVATIVNVSIGGSGTAPGSCSSSGYDQQGSAASDFTEYYSAFCGAANAGAVIVVSAGNSGVDGNNFLPTHMTDTNIAVSAAWGGTASSNGDWWWDSSNWGQQSSAWNTKISAPIALGAPGFDIQSLSLNGGIEFGTGTSFAAPHVSAAAAMYLAANPQQNNYSAFENIRQLILDDSTSTDSFFNTSSFLHDENYLNVNQISQQITSSNRPLITLDESQQIESLATTNLTAIAEDSDGTISSFQWQQLSGPAINLTSTNSATTSFTAPTVSQLTSIYLMLVVTDNSGSKASAVQRIDVSAAPINTAPTSSNGSASTAFETNLTAQLTANDSDGDNLTYLIVSQVNSGSINLTESTGEFTYTPNGGFSGSDSFNFKVNDGTDESNVATFSITVNAKTVITPTPTSSSGGGPINLVILMLITGLLPIRRFITKCHLIV